MPKVAPKGQVSTFSVDRFDGGLNLRDAPTEIAPNETPDCMNVTLDERGGVESRLGISKLNAASLLPAAPVALYFSRNCDALVAYISTDAGVGKLYSSTDGGVTWATFYTTLTAGGEGSFVDFKNRLVFVNTLDGVYSFPSDLTAPVHTVGGSGNMEEVRGSAIAVWQNKCWVTGDPREDATHSRARVWHSNAGNEQLWTVASAFVDIRDVNTEPCTAIGAGVGMDVTGKPTLLVFKDTSTYRINDSATGAYTTLHSKGAGAASARAVASNLGRICSINSEGIWVTDGLAVPIRVSDKLQPLFTQDGLNFGALERACAAPYRDRIVFCLPRAGSSTNDLMLEYHPEIGWTVPHKLSLAALTVYTMQTAKLIGAAAGGGQVYEVFKGGTDDGTAIAARYQTPWVPLAQGDEARLRQLRIFGRGTISAQVLEDFATIGDVYTLAFDQGYGFVWDTDSWDSGSWGNPAIESDADEPLDQVCKHVSLLFSASTTTTATKTALLGDGVAPEVGAWAVYGAKFDYVQLGT